MDSFTQRFDRSCSLPFVLRFSNPRAQFVAKGASLSTELAQFTTERASVSNARDADTRHRYARRHGSQLPKQHASSFGQQQVRLHVHGMSHWGAQGSGGRP